MRYLIILLIIFITTSSFATTFKGKFIQGSFIIGKTEPGTKVIIDKTKVRVTDDGFFVFGLGRDRNYDVVITLNQNGEEKKIIKKVQKREYKIQRIDGLEKKKVTPPEEVYERIKKENNLISKARIINSDLIFFKNKFIVPVENYIVTGVYGSQRILNGKPRWPHYGLDFSADKGTKVMAMLSGKATLVEEDLFYTGGTLIFDHGHGVSTLYMHMDKIFVKNGQNVRQGDVIGTVGATGRATGPHLDVRLNWFQERLDPATALDIKIND
jgi:murein DD-endopeptidase MepM/ murein hydrolase activator NlpD